jgi:thioredoxin-like negative regulator of GroEL
VNSIPTLLILERGQEVDRIVGLAPAEEIRQRLNARVQR